MATLIYILFLFSLFHFVYQGILLPSIRLSIRFKLFSLRDELRRIKLENGSTPDDNAIYILQQSINRLVKNLAFFDITTIIETKKYLKDNPKTMKDIESKYHLIDNSNIPQIKNIYRILYHQSALTILSNNGGLVIYIIPVMLISLTFKGIKNLIKKIVFVPEQDWNKIINEDEIALV